MIKLKLELLNEEKRYKKLKTIYDGYKVNHEAKKYVEEMMKTSMELINELTERIESAPPNLCLFCGDSIEGDGKFCNESCLLAAIES